MKPALVTTLLALAATAGCTSSSAPSGDNSQRPSPVTFAAIGDSATVAAKLDQFRIALGGSLNPPTMPATNSGRREINWDGVPAALTNVDTFPGTFFNVNSPRGAVLIPQVPGLRVDSTAFASLNPGLAGQFKFFSAKKMFAPVGSKFLTVKFQLAGTQTPGLVSGFGVVFSDVDAAGSTRVEFLDANGSILASLTAPGRLGSHEFSFIGAVFDSSVVAKVQITCGQTVLSSAAVDVSDLDQGADFVAMDDFVYGEPQPIPQ